MRDLDESLEGYVFAPKRESTVQKWVSYGFFLINGIIVPKKNLTQKNLLCFTFS